MFIREPQTWVKSHASSVQRWQKPSSRTPVCFPGRAGLLGCSLDCLDLAHPVKTGNTTVNSRRQYLRKHSITDLNRGLQLPVLMLRLKKHRKLDSNDSEVYLSICFHLHTLQNMKKQIDGTM